MHYSPSMSEEPLRTTTFTLTRADALAYEQAVFRWGWRGGLLLAVWLLACGGAALLIPAEWGGPRFSVSSSLLVSIAIVIGVVLVLLVIASRQALAARRRLPRPVEVTLNEWPDRLTLSGAETRELAYAALEPLASPTHLFLRNAGAPLLLPRAAFHDDTSLDALLQRIDTARAAASSVAVSPAAEVDPAPPSA